MSAVATQIRQGIQAVAVAGTPVQLQDEEGAAAPVVQVTVTALGTNEGTVVIGGHGVVAAAGTHAAPTQNGIPLAKGEKVTLPVFDVGAIWVDATSTGDGVSWTALAA